MTADWSPELTLNNDLLDTEHVELFRKLEAAAAALDGPVEALDAAVGAFAEALMEHLAIEERLMDETLYPERIRHKSAHELFVADFERMRAELRAAGATAAVAEWVRRRTPEWLAFHIRVNDVPLATWLARRRRPDDGDDKPPARRYS
jgi:hemerythrin